MGRRNLEGEAWASRERRRCSTLNLLSASSEVTTTTAEHAGADRPRVGHGLLPMECAEREARRLVLGCHEAADDERQLIKDCPRYMRACAIASACYSALTTPLPNLQQSTLAGRVFTARARPRRRTPSPEFSLQRPDRAEQIELRAEVPCICTFAGLGSARDAEQQPSTPCRELTFTTASSPSWAHRHRQVQESVVPCGVYSV